MNDHEVAGYLLANPDFFDRHAELLASIKLKSPYGSRAVSLQERQLDMLRGKYKQLERRLAQLLDCAHQHDRLAGKLDLLIARVSAARDPLALPHTITAGLREIFDVPQAALRLWHIAEPYSASLADFAHQADNEMRLFANRLAQPYCGVNTGFEAVAWLRADRTASAGQTAEPSSIVLLALRDPQHAAAEAFGLLVMGSPDPRRFRAQTATDFLLRIGLLTSAALSRLLAH